MKSTHLMTGQIDLASITKHRIFFLLLTFFFSLGSFAQIIGWNSAVNGTGGGQTFGSSPWAPSNLINANLSMVGTGLIRGSNITASGTGAASSWGGSGGWGGTSDAGCVYFSFTANAGFQVSISSISASIRRSNSGPATGGFEYSINGGAYVNCGTWTAGNGSGQLNTFALSGITALQNVPAGTVIKFRFTFPSGSNWYLTNGNSSLNVYGTVSAAVPAGPTVTILRTGTISCNGMTDGELTATVTAGTGPFTYTWLPTGGSASVATGLGAGTYTCLVKDAANATSSPTFALVQPPVLSASIPTPTDVTCNGGSNGVANVITTGGTTGYTYSWSPSGGAGAVASNLAAGIYTVTVADSKSCTTSQTVTITEPATPVVVTATVSSPVICEGATLALSGSGANTYTWTGGATDGVPFSPAVSGTYSVTGEDMNGCLGFASISVTVNPAPVITVNNGAVCPGDTYVLTPGGAWTYTFSSGTATVVPATTSTYSITGTSQEGCEALAPTIATVVVAANLSVTISGPSAVCYGETANLTAGGASSYTWSSSDVTYTIAPTLTTQTTYTVSGASGACSNTAAITVSVNSLPAVSVSGTSVICSGETLTVAASGAATYSWSTGDVTSSISQSLTSNAVPALFNYTVTGTDLNHCSNVSVHAFTVNPTPTITASSGTVCAGKPFTLTPVGAATYTFSGGAVVSPVTTTNYSITGTNTLGCRSTSPAVVTVTANTLPTITVNNGSVCAGKTFTLVAGGAVTYTFTDVSAALVSSLVVPTGNTSYSVSGTSSLGCVSSAPAVANVTVNALPVITVNSGSVCSGATFSMSPGGAATYTYSSGAYTVVPTGNASYSVSGTSSVGCVSSSSAVANVTVHPLPVISVNSGSVCAGSSFTLIPSGASVYNFSSGSATVTPVNTITYYVSGTSSLGCVSSGSAMTTVTVVSRPVIAVNNGTICSGDTFTLAPSGAATYVFAGGSATVNPATTTSYTVTGTSSVGCTSQNTATSVITVNALPTLSVAGTFTACEGSSVTLTVTGATNYTWSTGSTTSSISDAPTTNTVYSLTGADSKGCINTASQSVTIHPAPVLAMSNGTICPGDSFTLAASGAGTYTYSSGPVIVPANTATYTVTGTSTLGCLSLTSATAVVTVTNAIVVSTSGTTTICNGKAADITASGATTYTWTGGIVSPSFAPTPSVNTTYTVTGSSGSCSNTAVVSVSVLPTPTLQVTSTRTTMCAGESATISVNGASAYSWNTGSTATFVTLTTSTAGAVSFTVNGTNSSGCSAQKVFVQSVSTCVGIQNFDNKDQVVFNVYPNPNAGEFTIQSDLNTSFRIINELGELIRTCEAADFTDREIKIKGLAPGIYFITASHSTYPSRKIVVTK